MRLRNIRGEPMFRCFPVLVNSGADTMQARQILRQYRSVARGRALGEALFPSPAKALAAAEFLGNPCRRRTTARRVGRPRAQNSV